MRVIRLKFLAAFLAVCMLTTMYTPLTGATVGTSDLDVLVAKMDSIYRTLEDSEKQDIEAAQTKAAALADDSANYALVSEIWDGIDAKLATAGEAPVDQITQDRILELLAYISSIYEPSEHGQGTIAELPPELRATLEQMVALANLSGTIGTITKEDIAEFSLALEGAAWALLPDTYAELVNLAQDKEQMKVLAEQAVDAVFADDFVSDVKNLLVYYGVTKSDMKSVLGKMKAEIDPEKDAAMALLFGYLRSVTYPSHLGNPAKINGFAYNFYEVKVGKISDVPVSSFTWTSSNPKVTVSVVEEEDEILGTLQYLRIASTSGTAETAEIKAEFKDLGAADPYDLLAGRTLFSEKITVGGKSGVSPVTEEVYSLVPGQTVYVQYVLDGFLKGDRTNSAQFDIKYDATVFELAGATVADSVYKMNIPGHVGHNVNGNVGTISYSVAESDPAISYSLYNGVPAYMVVLRVKANAAPGAYEITSPENEIMVFGKNATVAVPVKIAPKTITYNVAAAPLTVKSKQQLSAITVLRGTQLNALNLPVKVTVTLSNDSTIDVPVTWDSGTPSYNANTLGTYKFKGTLNYSGFGNVHLHTGDETITVDVIVWEPDSNTEGGTPPPPTNPDGESNPADQVGKQLDELFGNLPGNSQPNNNLKREAAKVAEKAIKEAAKVDVKENIVVENGVAKLALTADAVKDQFQSIKALADQVNAKLKEKDPNAAPARVVATLSLGAVEGGKAQISLPPELVQAAKENGIDELAIEINGVFISVDVDELGEGTTLDIAEEDGSVADEVTDKPRASGVYTFEFTSSGEAQTFFQNPVDLSLPAEVVGVDPELLTLTKIVDGRTEYYGGKYDQETKTHNASRTNFSTYTVVENKVVFNDIAQVASWAGRGIEVAAAKGIITGRGEGVYDPQSNVTRAEFATLLVKTFGLENPSLKESFEDVKDGEWFQPYVAAAVNNGIVSGRSATEFDPHSSITRAEMATMAANALRQVLNYEDVANVNASLKKFKDAAAVQSWFKASVALMASEGLINGKGQGQFDPNGTSTRAEAAVIIYRLFNLQ